MDKQVLVEKHLEELYETKRKLCPNVTTILFLSGVHPFPLDLFQSLDHIHLIWLASITKPGCPKMT